MGNTLKNERVLVTGANGFIGAWLCKKLVENGTEVVAVIHGSSGLLETHGIDDQVKKIKADIGDKETVQRMFTEEKPAVCFHLAAKSSTREAAKDLDETFETNVMGTLNMLASAKETGCAVVFASSVKVYGGFTEKCFGEGHVLNGTSAYAASKIAAEAACRMFAKNLDASVGIARPGNVFGGFDDNVSRLVPGAVKRALEGKPPFIRGKGESLLDFVYVEDVVGGIILLGEKAKEDKMAAEAFNFGSGEKRSVKEIIGKIFAIAGNDSKPKFSGDEDLLNECLCIEKAKSELGWKPKHNLEEGIRKTVDCSKKGA